MNRILLGLVALASLATLSAHAEKETGFTSLFDGKTVSGWTGKAGGAPGAGWKVVDGTLHRAERAGDIYSEKEYGDFDFRFSWKVAPGSNSGVKYRVADFNGKLLGPEYQVLDDVKHSNGKNPKTSASAMYALFPAAADKPSRPAGEWNEGRIVCKGSVLQHWLNGKMVLEVDTGSKAFAKAIADSKFKNVKGFGKNAKGRLMLQDHNDPVWFRNLRIKSL